MSSRRTTRALLAGDTWTISPNLVNDLRYGYIRQGFSQRGVGSGDYVRLPLLVHAHRRKPRTALSASR